MSEQYIDPNSGAASQPGGIFVGGYEGAATESEAPTAPDTEPGAPAEGEKPEGETPETPETPEAPEGDGEGEKLDGEGGGEEGPESEVGADGGDEGAPAEGFNPSDHTVAEVLAYIAENPDQKDAVIAAEKDGKNRTTVVGA